MNKILIIDDDERLTGLYEMLLKGQGYDVKTSVDSKTGIDMLNDDKPDLVVLDAMMPVVSGFQVLEIIKSNIETKHIKVIMLTALSDDKIKEKALSLGADDYIVKSETNVPEIIKKINGLLGKIL